MPPIARSRRPSTIRSILVLLGGLIVILPVIGWTDKSKDPKTAFIVLACALALTIIVHELGHLSAGWMVGFRFNTIHLGPFSLGVEHGRLKMRVRREMLAAGATGMHVRTVRRLRRRLLFFTMGGPLANMVSVPITVVLVNHVFPQFANTPLGALAAQFTVFSLISAMVNLMPIRSGVLLSDGARIEMLLRSRERGRRWLSIAAVGKLHDEGVRPRDWRRTWLNAAASVCDVSLETSMGNWLAYVSTSDRKDGRSAVVHLERCLESTGKMPVSIRDLVAQEAAFFSAWFRNDGPLADKWFTQVKKPRLMQKLVRLRLEVAMCCAHGDYDTADLAWQRGLAFIETATAGSAQFRLRESWLEWQVEIRERQAQQPHLLSDAT